MIGLRPPVASPADEVRRLAGRGVLAADYSSAPEQIRRQLHSGAYELCFPLVFQHITSRAERTRGHFSCAASIRALQADCLDRFHDDVEAVVDDLLTHAKVPISNLEGWLTSRLRQATVDGYRRRRGELGAVQRPRLPAWLHRELHGDPWLTWLAMAVLEWTGVPATAGVEMWPLQRWTDQRAQTTGDYQSTPRDTAADLERVLVAMRRRPGWYERFVERPLGNKQVPVAPDGSGLPVLVEPSEADDARLLALAVVALATIKQRLQDGEDLHPAVTETLYTVFDTGDIDARDLERPPGDEPDDTWVGKFINDPDMRDRIVATVQELLKDDS